MIFHSAPRPEIQPAITTTNRPARGFVRDDPLKEGNYHRRLPHEQSRARVPSRHRPEERQDSAWNSGASFRGNGARVITEQAAQKIAARARFAQRLAKRHDKHREEFADSLRPRVTVDMGGAK